MNLYQQWCIKKAKIKLHRLLKYYPADGKILEIGSGNGALTHLLQQAGKSVTALDIVNKSVFAEVVPILYDGKRLPFADGEFEVVQLITMLHHTAQPEQLVKEAMRVGKMLIIMEDIYENSAQKYLTFVADSVNNWEFIGHPHSNKTDAAWRQLFANNGLQIVETAYYPFLWLFRQVTYVLSK